MTGLIYIKINNSTTAAFASVAELNTKLACSAGTLNYIALLRILQ